MRLMVVETGERVDGRTPTEVRPLMVKGDYLPRVHGSGLFQRGQTQVLSVCTLGMLNEWQRLDTIEPVDGKRYIHHYNFPPFCTGETGRMGSPKRREIGHGNLAERALLPVIPSEDEFPYTIRVVSEVMESNGSSSMASTCGSTLALMDAGVPIKRPVSGVAMGLIQEEGKTVVLTDIQGLEDFLGDMDFKVTGTTKGITAMQMDNKATGLTPEILRSALMQAHDGPHVHPRRHARRRPRRPREQTKESAPQIISLQIPTDKIRDVIGSGGKVIRGIQEDTGATIDIQEDGTVFIAGVGTAGDAAAERIKAIVKVPEVGEEYTGRVVGIQPFGAFVELAARQGRPAPHLPRCPGPRRQGRGRPQHRRRGQGPRPRGRREGQDQPRPPRQARGPGRLRPRPRGREGPPAPRAPRAAPPSRRQGRNRREAPAAPPSRGVVPRPDSPCGIARGRRACYGSANPAPGLSCNATRRRSYRPAV